MLFARSDSSPNPPATAPFGCFQPVWRHALALAAWCAALRARSHAGLLSSLAAAFLGCGAFQASAWQEEALLRSAQARSTRALDGARTLQAVMATLTSADEPARLATINQFFNRRIVFAEDTLVWGEVDHWASPLELLDKGRGDCEDYVIGKYFSLLALGVPTGRMRLVYVRAQLGGRTLPHMVLAYYAEPGAEPLILDNLVADIRPASRRTDLEPVFSFNSEGLWQGTGGQTAGDPVARLSRWRDVLARSRGEGF